MNRLKIFNTIKERILDLQVEKDKPIRVGVNGVEGAGKTTFAFELVKYLQEEGLVSLHVSTDGYHQPKAHRYRKGRDSADGYFEDAYNEKAFVEHVLLASQTSPASYVAAIHDLESDEPLQFNPESMDDKAIIITDGAYLFKKIYRQHWDLKIYLDVPFDIARARGIERDHEAQGGRDKAEAKYHSRYHAASKRYISENNPRSIADLIIDNSDFNAPVVVVCE